VVPCCFDKDAHHVLGDLRTLPTGRQAHSFRELWHSAAYNDFRRSLLHSRSSIEMCRNCSEGSPVWA
jgi:hypothetical protein